MLWEIPNSFTCSKMGIKMLDRLEGLDLLLGSHRIPLAKSVLESAAHEERGKQNWKDR